MRTVLVCVILLAVVWSGCMSDYATYETDRLSIELPREWVRERIDASVVAHPDSGGRWYLGPFVQLEGGDSTPEKYRKRVAAWRTDPQPSTPYQVDVPGAKDVYAIDQGVTTYVYALAMDGRSHLLLSVSSPTGAELDVDHVIRSLRIK